MHHIFIITYCITVIGQSQVLYSWLQCIYQYNGKIIIVSIIHKPHNISLLVQYINCSAESIPLCMSAGDDASGIVQ